MNQTVNGIQRETLGRLTRLLRKRERANDSMVRQGYKQLQPITYLKNTEGDG